MVVGDGFAIVTFRGTEPDQSSDIFDDARFALVPWDDTGASVHAVDIWNDDAQHGD